MNFIKFEDGSWLNLDTVETVKSVFRETAPGGRSLKFHTVNGLVIESEMSSDKFEEVLASKGRADSQQQGEVSVSLRLRAKRARELLAMGSGAWVLKGPLGNDVIDIIRAVANLE